MKKSSQKYFIVLYLIANLAMVPAVWYFEGESNLVVFGVVGPLMFAGWLFGHLLTMPNPFGKEKPDTESDEK